MELGIWVEKKVNEGEAQMKKEIKKKEIGNGGF